MLINAVAPSLGKASIILVDRSEDWYTPTSYTGVETQSLAHRVYNALKFSAASSSSQEEEDVVMNSKNDIIQSCRTASKKLDLVIQPSSMTLLEECIGLPQNQQQPESNNLALYKPMSALAGLAFQSKPSLCFHCDEIIQSNSGDMTDRVRELFYTRTEDQFRAMVVEMLKEVIVAEKGTLPANKKRGLGAEILALVQAVLDAPGNGQPKGIVAYRHGHLLSMCLAIIETMQRSSGKQFQSLCNWKCAVDVRFARDLELASALMPNSNNDCMEDFDVVVTKMMKLFLQSCHKNVTSSLSSSTSSVNTSISSSTTSPQKPPVKKTQTKSATKEDDSKDGPPDAIHILLQLIG